MAEDKNKLNNTTASTPETVEYTDDNIRHLSDMEHIRTRPGMYWATVRCPRTVFMCC